MTGAAAADGDAVVREAARGCAAVARKITADLLVDSRQRQRGKPHVPLPPCISELVLRCGYAPARFAHLAGMRMLEGRVTEVDVHVAVV